MSGICGVVNLDGAPLDRTLLGRMTDAMACRGPDGAGQWADGSVGLGHRMFRTTPESLGEQQPLTDETGTLCLVLDGRVDNRGELRKALEDKGCRLRDDTDAELVLRAYQCWGEEAPARIIGDFAFAVWDGGQRRLFCARDAIGIRPFYYLREDRRFLFGSDLRALFADPAVSKEPNLGMVGEYLADQITSTEETLYKGVMRLPGAHSLIVAPGRHEKRRYWDIDPAVEILHRTDTEYAEHFLEIFREAVRCRMRSPGPVGAELSGGLDSSAVVAIAEDLRRGEGAAKGGFETFSLVFPGLPCDESGYIRAVADRVGVGNHAVTPLITDQAFYLEQARESRDLPDSPNGVMAEPLQAAARARGVRVLLTGQGGDQWFTGSDHRYADYLSSLKFGLFFRELFADRRMLGRPKQLLRLVLQSLLSPQAKRHIRKIRGGRPRWTQWVDGRFARETGLAERVRRRSFPRRMRTLALEDDHLQLSSGLQAFSLEHEERAGAQLGLELRHPFYDRRVVEFAFALPEDQRSRGGGIKHVLREAMRGLLPEEVRARATKAEFSPVTIQTLRRFGAQGFLETPRIGSLEWVNQAKVAEMYRRTMNECTHGEKYHEDIWPLWMISAVSMWYNSRNETGTCPNVSK